MKFVATKSVSTSKHSDQLKSWDALIRAGQGFKVKSLCRQLNFNKIPRSFLIEYAQVARRVGAENLIIRWLSPIVHSEKTQQVPATANEKAMYALGLLRCGAFREAEEILKEADPALDPQIHFYRASLNINQWNYGPAVRDLKKYIRHKAVPSYSRLVGRLNLCAALVTLENQESAEKEIQQLMEKLERQKRFLLKGNLLEIRSQMLSNQGKYKEAFADLESAAQLLQKADERSLIWVLKWRIAIQLKAKSPTLDLLAQLEDLKVRAIAVTDWETVRDCDLQKALALKDRQLMLRVYWGSRFPAYRERVLKLCVCLMSAMNLIGSVIRKDRTSKS